MSRMLEETRPDGHGRARGLVSNRASGERLRARTFAPRPDLRAVVDYYWSTSWDLRGQAPHVAELLADPCVNVVLEEGRSRVVGVSTRIFRRELTGAGLIRSVKLRAGAARALLRHQTIAELTDRMIPLETFFHDVRELEAAVLSPEEDQTAFARLEAWLEAHIHNDPDPRTTLAASIVERITREPVLATSGQVAAAVGMSTRHLQRIFHDEVGASPKWVIRRVRLQEAALRLERGELASLAALAAELGYSDHAHLTRDFTAATGRSPTTFMRTVWEKP